MLLDKLLYVVNKRYMMKSLRIAISLLIVVFTSYAINAQDFDRPNGFGGQLLLIDHASFEEGQDFGFGGLTTGFEFSYSRHLNKFISLRVPFKGGLLSSGEFDFAKNRSFIGLDLTVQATYFGNESPVAPFVYAGFGGTKEEGVDMYQQIPVGAGANFRIGKWGFFQVKAEYRSDLNNDLPRKNMQYGLGLVAIVGPTLTTKEIEKMLSDTDGDGIDDDKDRCPNIAGRKQFGGCLDSDNDGIGDADDSCPDVIGLKALNGCPDSDADGVADIVDDCPNTVGTANGCPDADQDGVADAKDKCPDLPGTAGFGGCPEAPASDVVSVTTTDKMEDENVTLDATIKEDTNDMTSKGAKGLMVDSDGDSFSDADDECPNTAGTVNGCPDSDGDGFADRFDACPNSMGSLAGCPDSDDDGIADYKDTCPNAKGTSLNNGCPEITNTAPVIVNRAPARTDYTNYNTNTRLVPESAMTLMSDATKRVQFKVLSNDLTADSYDVLNQVVNLMISNPQYQLKVSGHTDDRGQDTVNQRLSEKRARECIRYLRERGVPENQMSYIGFGARFPVAENESEYGRSQNRRVDFQLFLMN